MVSLSTQLLSQNAFGYVIPITSFVVAWLETWFLDFKVLTQEADDERGEREISDKFEHDSTKICFSFSNYFSSLTSAYLAAVNAACERAPMIYPRAVSDGQFYSPPESVAGDVCSSVVIGPCLVSLCVGLSGFIMSFLFEPHFEFWLCLQDLKRIWMRRVLDAKLSLHRYLHQSEESLYSSPDHD